MNDEIYNELRTMIRNRARARFSVPMADLDDIVQKVTLRLHKYWDKIAPENIKRTAHRFLRNACGRYWKEKNGLNMAKLSEIDKVIPTPSDFAEYMKNINPKILKQIFNLLPDNLQEAMTLYYIYNFDPESASDILGIAVPAYRMRITRGNRALKFFLMEINLILEQSKYEFRDEV